MDGFVQGNRHLKWCPSPNCDKVAEYKAGGEKEIECRCSHVFCFKCSREGHRPCSCDLVRIWQEKNSTDSENVNWIIANTKRCPKCTVCTIIAFFLSLLTCLGRSTLRRTRAAIICLAETASLNSAGSAKATGQTTAVPPVGTTDVTSMRTSRSKASLPTSNPRRQKLRKLVMRYRSICSTLHDLTITKSRFCLRRRLGNKPNVRGTCLADRRALV